MSISQSRLKSTAKFLEVSKARIEEKRAEQRERQRNDRIRQKRIKDLLGTAAMRLAEQGDLDGYTLRDILSQALVNQVDRDHFSLD